MNTAERSAEAAARLGSQAAAAAASRAVEGEDRAYGQPGVTRARKQVTAVDRRAAHAQTSASGGKRAARAAGARVKRDSAGRPRRYLPWAAR